MANIKISALPQYSAAVNPDIYFVNNNSGETETNKIQLKQFNGMTTTNGNNTVQSNSYLTSLGTTANTESAIAIGNGAEATSPYSIAIGYQARNDNRDGGRDNYICIGTNSRAVQESFALGTDAKALGSDTCSVGKNAGTYGNSGLAVGKNSLEYSTGGIALGVDAFDSSNNYGMALGASAQASSDYSLAIGYNAQTDDVGAVAIGKNARAQGEYSTVVGGSGHTEYNTSTNSVILGGIDNEIASSINGAIIASKNSSQNSGFTYGTNTVAMIGCVDTDITNSYNSVVLGVSGRTLTTVVNTTVVDKLFIYGNVTYEPTIFTNSGTCNIDIFNMSHVIIDATGGTYTLSINPEPSAEGTPEVTLLINVSGGATIAFNNAGNTQWRWGNGAGTPTFTDNTRSIIKMAAWDGNDVYEISRSMNMA
jgi:hypothetical protein